MLAKCVLQYAVTGKMCYFWRNVYFLEKCLLFGEMSKKCAVFLEKCAVFGEMCYFWRNVLFLEKCFGKKNVLPKKRNVHINTFDAYSKC